MLLTGKAIFPVTTTTGRLHLYDGNGTLHEHPCRVVVGAEPIAKGVRVRVVDKDSKTGALMVEEATN